MSNKYATTIRLSDTADQYARKVHVNVRNGKPTMVYRWKDHHSSKAHTQRMTLTDEQAGRLLNALALNAAAAIESSGNAERAQALLNAMD